MSQDDKKTQKQLIEELAKLRRKAGEAESRHRQNAVGGENNMVAPGSLADSLDDIRDGLVQLDERGTIVDVNQAAADMYGGSKDELIGKHFTQIGIFSPKDIPGLLSQFGDLLCGRNRESTLQITNILGRVLFLESSLLVQKAVNGTVGIVAVIRDITVRKQSELQLQTYAHDLGERIKELRGLYGLSRLTGNSDQTPEIVFQQAVELLPPAWHYPKITCAKISMYGKEYTTANYAECAWKQVAEIRAFNDVVGSIEIGYLEEMPQLHEGPFLLEERQLIDTMALELGQYQAEYKLRENHTRLIEGQLSLENKNTALAELVDHIEREKQELACRIQSNADRVIGPMLTRLETQLDESQKGQLAMIRSSLNDLTAPFISRLEQGLTRLTPREVEICNLIKNGYSSKDIAQNLHTCEATVKTQRKTIRRKLGLAKSKENLATYLHQV